MESILTEGDREHSGSLYLIFRSKLLSVVPMLSATPAIREYDITSQGRSSLLVRDNAIYDFCKKSVENGLDIFRVFDSLNYIGMPSPSTGAKSILTITCRERSYENKPGTHY